MARETRTPAFERERAHTRHDETPIPADDGGLREDIVGRLVASVVPARSRDAAQRVVDRAVGTLSSNASIVQVVGGGGVLLSVLYALSHGFFGLFPERRYYEVLQESRALELKVKELETELSRTRESWAQCLEHAGDGDATGEEVP